MRSGHGVTRGKLTDLVGMEDHWPAATFKCHPQGIESELGVKAVGELRAVAEGFYEWVHVPDEQIHHRHQVEEGFLQWDVGDVGDPGLIHSRDRHEIKQAGEPDGWIALNRGMGHLENRP